MRRHTFLIAGIIAMFALSAFPKDPVEVYFSFRVNYRAELDSLMKIISIDQVKNDIVFAYANNKQFALFKTKGYLYTILPNPGDQYKPPVPRPNGLAAQPAAAGKFDTYPTYPAYVSMMNQFASSYPNLCLIENLGYSVNGHEILAAKISANVSQNGTKPNVLLTGSVHGDETGPYMLMLRMIDYLLSHYANDSRIANILNNLCVYINPLENPDGTYFQSDNSIEGCQRFNTNGVDINRNMPFIPEGLSGDGGAFEPETQAMMQFLDSNAVTLSGDFHAGFEVLGYPWFGLIQDHADANWYYNIGIAYGSSAQANGPAGYFTDQSANGTVNGYSCSPAIGTKADYMNFWKRGREVAIEISETKTLPDADLTNYWNYNWQAMLGFIEQALYGIRGIVTDRATGLPLAAAIEVPGHDVDRSGIWTNPNNGLYCRLLASGTYSLVFRAPGYVSQTLNNVSITYGQAKTLNVSLSKVSNPPGFFVKKGTVPYFCMNASNGDLSILGVSQASPFRGLLFQATGNAAAIDNCGNLTNAGVNVSQGSFLNTPSNLSGGMVVRDPNGVAVVHFSTGGITRIRGQFFPSFATN